MSKQYTAFTLAEVLITLAVIGVVAAISIPSLQASIQRNKYDAGLKKAYADLSQAAAMVKEENGGTLFNFFSGSTVTEKTTSARDAFAKHMSVQKKCTSGASNFGECWSAQTESLYKYTGEYDGWWPATGVGMKLNDGRFMMFYHFYNTDCSTSDVSGWKIPDAGACGSVFVDINGVQSPNRLGYDIYDFIIYPDRLKPNGDGATCASEGWECASYFLVN